MTSVSFSDVAIADTSLDPDDASDDLASNCGVRSVMICNVHTSPRGWGCLISSLVSAGASAKINIWCGEEWFRHTTCRCQASGWNSRSLLVAQRFLEDFPFGCRGTLRAYLNIYSQKTKVMRKRELTVTSGYSIPLRRCLQKVDNNGILSVLKQFRCASSFMFFEEWIDIHRWIRCFSHRHHLTMASNTHPGYKPNVMACWFDRCVKAGWCQDSSVIWRAAATHLYFNKVGIWVRHIGSKCWKCNLEFILMLCFEQIRTNRTNLEKRIGQWAWKWHLHNHVANLTNWTTFLFLLPNEVALYRWMLSEHHLFITVEYSSENKP